MSSTKKMVVEWKGNLRLTAKNEKGLSVNFDAPIPHGGEETALSPMENVLSSLAACGSFHVKHTEKEENYGYRLFCGSYRREERKPTT